MTTAIRLASDQDDYYNNGITIEGNGTTTEFDTSIWFPSTDITNVNLFIVTDTEANTWEPVTDNPAYAFSLTLDQYGMATIHFTTPPANGVYVVIVRDLAPIWIGQVDSGDFLTANDLNVPRAIDYVQRIDQQGLYNNTNPRGVPHLNSSSGPSSTDPDWVAKGLLPVLQAKSNNMNYVWSADDEGKYVTVPMYPPTSADGLKALLAQGFLEGTPSGATHVGVDLSESIQGDTNANRTVQYFIDILTTEATSLSDNGSNWVCAWTGAGTSNTLQEIVTNLTLPATSGTSSAANNIPAYLAGDSQPARTVQFILNVLVTQINSLKTSIFPVGKVIAMMANGDAGPVGDATTPPGYLWIKANDTVGSAASGATYADDKYEALYKQMWRSIATPSPFVSTGGWYIDGTPGASAEADWSANKKLVMPPMVGGPVCAIGGGFDSGDETHSFGGATTPTYNYQAYHWYICYGVPS